MDGPSDAEKLPVTVRAFPLRERSTVVRCNRNGRKSRFALFSFPTAIPDAPDTTRAANFHSRLGPGSDHRERVRRAHVWVAELETRD